MTVYDTDKNDDMTGEPPVSLHQVALKWGQCMDQTSGYA